MTESPIAVPDWSPILEGEEAAQAGAAIAAIVAMTGLDAPLPARNRGPGLASGAAGIALFFEYLDRTRPGAGYGEIAQQRLERAIDALPARNPSLYGGFTGVSWAVEHLQGGFAAADGAGDAEDEDPNVDIDTALLALLSQSPWASEYDLVSGLVGYGVYALERLPRPSAADCLELLVERLAEIAQPRPGGIAWHTPLHLMPEPNRPTFPKGADNLGLAHGTPGVIALLARILSAGVATERAGALLEEAVSWLLTQKLPPGEVSVFPYCAGPDVRIRPARTAWCYGDPGIAMALLLAARAAGKPAWEREALDLARATAKRPPESCRVEDAGLCHGAAGLAHLLNRLYQATGDPELLPAARAWFGRALDFREPGRGVGGFLSFSPPDDDTTFDRLEWNEDAAFLTGSTGVALALLAATSGVEPAWDRMLLISPVPVGGLRGRG
ncbi:MAG TPA: lanthionine synthetase C family protein [Thermoanaerobaculia bacterium]|nr:lanthionine synthetase C family protein [Thermoanaerobaculia bacterium]